jgi:hypothetical protein
MSTTPTKSDYIKVQGNKQYLPVPQRVQWFRGDHPDWTIGTSVVELNWAEGYAVMRAEVSDDTGRLSASGIKTETRKGFGDFVEKAETGAVGRALARAGYGTEDALDLDGDRFADAPIEQPERGQSNTARAATTRPGGATTGRPRSGDDYRKVELLQVMREHGLEFSDVERYAAVVGIDRDKGATHEQMDALIDAVRGHGTDAPIESPVSSGPAEEPPGVSPAPAAPPKPGTPEYGALKPQDKASARAYWANPPEEPTLAEQLSVPA